MKWWCRKSSGNQYSVINESLVYRCVVTTSFITTTIVCPKSPLNDWAKLSFRCFLNCSLFLKWKLFYLSLFSLLLRRHPDRVSVLHRREIVNLLCSSMAILGNWAKKTTLKWKWELPQAVKGNNVGAGQTTAIKLHTPTITDYYNYCCCCHHPWHPPYVCAAPLTNWINGYHC